MAHYNFKKDLLDGQRAELEVFEFLENNHPEITKLERSDTKAFDIRGEYRGRTVTFEVKYDIMVEKTGNIAIEYESRGKPTGLAATEADYWVYKFLDQFFIYRTADLKKRLYDNMEFDRQVIGGDAGSNTKMFLVKVERFREWGRELF